MTSHGASRQALVFGASGLIGRHLVLTLAQAGANVTAAVRSEASAERVRRWLADHGLTQQVGTVIADFDAPGIIAGGPAALPHITEIHCCAGAFRFGMSAEEARSANVGIAEKVVDFAADLRKLQRLVYISGYRVGGQDPTAVPWSEEHRAAVYKELGGYEASKVESDAVFQARAIERRVPWTIINPATVIGDSATGETEQYIGMTKTIEQIWDGTAAALPAGDSTFLPVLTVDYMASFMAAAAVDPEAVDRAFWVLDDATPSLRELLTRAGNRLGAKVPRLQVPVGVIKRLPAWVTKADPETLGFLSSDRYPTGPAVELAARHGIPMPDVLLSIDRWVDYLAAHRFGAAKGGDRRFVDVAGVRTFELGDPEASRVILPGLPVNADTWAGVAAGSGARAVDLPGLGLSGGTGVQDWDEWLPALLRGDDVDLVGHSIGAGAAVLAAARFPERVRSLTLVAPFFLQAPGGLPAALKPFVSAYLRRTDAVKLSRRLTGADASAAALESSVSDLKRGTAPRVVSQLVRAGSKRWRAELRDALGRYTGPVRIITGSEDPLAPERVEELEARGNVELVTIQGAGHHPQLTHADVLTGLLRGAVARGARV